MDLDGIRLEIVRDLINTGRYEPSDTKFLIDNAQEIVKYIAAGELYRCDSSESMKKCVGDGVIQEIKNAPIYSDFNLPPVQYAIMSEINQAFADLGGGVGLFCIIGSWGDTLPQDEILEMLRDYNKKVKEEGWILQPAVFRQ